MTATEILNKNESVKKFCKNVIQNPDFRIWLKACLENMGPYRKGATLSEKEHIQLMISGGKEAVDVFISNLFELPFSESSEISEKIEFASPSVLHDLV